MLPTRLAPDVQLTRRGRSVVAVCLFAAAMAWLAGPRALNAVVAPGVVGLAAAYLQLRDLETPRVIRELPSDAHAGTTHELRLRFVDADDPTGGLSAPFVAQVTEGVDDGLGLERERVRTTVGAEDVRLQVRYERRGERRVGPTELVATDVLGLLRREFVCESVDTVLVYPRRHPVPGWFHRGLYEIEETGRSRERDEFDRLREYEEGDALRDIHWPTTAKRDELIVKEFVADAQRRSVSVSVGGSGAERSATAAASVALALLEGGVPVELSAPNGRVETYPGASSRELLALLARMPRGGVPNPDADVVIEASHRHTRIRTDDETYRFDRLREAATPGRNGEIGGADDGTDDGGPPAEPTPAFDGGGRSGRERRDKRGRGGGERP